MNDRDFMHYICLIDKVFNQLSSYLLIDKCFIDFLYD